MREAENDRGLPVVPEDPSIGIGYVQLLNSGRRAASCACSRDTMLECI